MGGKGGGGTDWNMVAGENAYNAAMGGASWDPSWDQTGYGSAMRQGFDMGTSERASQDAMWAMFSNFGSGSGSSGVDGDLMGYFDEDLGGSWVESDDSRWSQEQYDKWGGGGIGTGDNTGVDNQGLNDRDAAYTSYLDYAGRATDYVSKQIDSEQSNAALLGIDYSITNEQKATRINDYFSGIWSESRQTSLQGLFDTHGNPEGFEGFLVTRGNTPQTNSSSSSLVTDENSEESILG